MLVYLMKNIERNDMESIKQLSILICTLADRASHVY